jgi:hypothetical protein
MANSYLDATYQILYAVDDVWSLYTNGGVQYKYATAQAAVDVAKALWANDFYKIVQELSVTKTDTADTV